MAIQYYLKRDEVLSIIEQLQPKENYFEDIDDDDVDLCNKMWAANEVWYNFRTALQNLKPIKYEQ